MAEQQLHDKILDIAIQRGFLLPSAEIYGQWGGFYDYGPLGSQIKRHIENIWRIKLLRDGEFHEIETSIILPEAVLKASGHAANFTDPLTNCEKCKKSWRADTLLEEKTKTSWAGKNPKDLSEALAANQVACPDCKGKLLAVGSFNLMFATQVGGGGNIAYCRPETAQGIFLDFPHIFRQNGQKLPLGIGQVGKSFRNEISPRQGLVRMREFTQMELEYFFNPNKATMEGFAKVAGYKVRVKRPEANEAAEISLSDGIAGGIFPNEIFAYFIYKTAEYYKFIGVPEEKFHFKVLAKNEMPHYSKGNVDLEVNTSYGWIETVGIAYRTDYDLASHAKHSKQDLSVFVEEEKGRIVPHVIEPSFGVDRLFYCLLESCYRPATKERDWEWFAFPPFVAPYIAGVFPLMKKDGLAEKAEEVVGALRALGLDARYSESGSIGKRYARADEVGVPYCITIDYQTKEDNTVTIRFRDDAKQIRMKISELAVLHQWAASGKVNA